MPKDFQHLSFVLAAALAVGLAPARAAKATPEIFAVTRQDNLTMVMHRDNHNNTVAMGHSDNNKPSPQAQRYLDYMQDAQQRHIGFTCKGADGRQVIEVTAIGPDARQRALEFFHETSTISPICG